MKLSNVLLLAAIVYAIFGIGFLIVPNEVASLYGVTLDAQAALMARYFGAASIGLAALAWMAREDTESRAGRAVVTANLVYVALGAILSLIGVTSAGLLNSFGWTAVVLYLLLAAGYGYFLFVKPMPMARAT